MFWHLDVEQTCDAPKLFMLPSCRIRGIAFPPALRRQKEEPPCIPHASPPPSRSSSPCRSRPRLVFRRPRPDACSRPTASSATEPTGAAASRKLAGKSANEIYSELKEMQRRSEGNDLMVPHAKGYTDEQLRAIGGYFATVR